MPAYLKAGFTLAKGGAADQAVVRALQHDLRALGYLAHGIDGAFGDSTVRALRALQIDLLGNDGSGSDGRAPIAIKDFNADQQGVNRVQAVTGTLDQPLAACLADLMADVRVTKLPASSDPRSENAAARVAISSTVSAVAPTPFIAAMVIQESSGQHFNVPRPSDDDTFVTVGLDRNDKQQSDRITSRGYGMGQYTLFHHPPTKGEVAEYILDPVRNVQHAYKELRAKFDGFVAGPHDRASDRDAEHPHLAMRLCKYQPSHPLFLRDCKACAMAARKVAIERGTPFYQGATAGYQPDQYYPSASYANVPDRADFACDWPYAARRYNGSGNNSFHYQTRILLNLLK